MTNARPPEVTMGPPDSFDVLPPIGSLPAWAGTVEYPPPPPQRTDRAWRRAQSRAQRRIGGAS